MDDLDRLERLDRLRQRGALTEEEFQAQKARLLGGQVPPGRPQDVRWLWAAIPLIVLLLAALATFGLGRSEPQIAAKAAAIGAGTAAARDPMNPLTRSGDETSPVLPASASQPYAMATSTAVIGVNPAYLEAKLGPAREKGRGFMTFEVAGCLVHYDVEESKITSFSADVSDHCHPAVHGDPVTPRTSFGQLLREASWGGFRADCIDACGNAADPSIELFYPGSRASQFMEVSYEASRHEQIGQAMDRWEQHIRRQRGLAEFEMPADLETFSCVDAPRPVSSPHFGGSRWRP
ncbi:MAG: SHOCT domain-containing protein [Chloroflexota bacterium]|nr:SHOCT domain-containing protein [Chloroflexota bacterium]